MRRTIAALGRVLITVGLLILLFVGYQLWGTGIIAARAQDRLESEYEQLKAEYEATSTTSSSTTSSTAPETTTTTGPTQLPAFAPGDALGVLRIPRAGVDDVFVSGVAREDLMKGPGHYPGTPMPGQRGNAAIAGHRTTYGAPFYDLDSLRPATADSSGDWIVVDSLLGTHVFEVIAKDVVAPTDTWVAGPVAAMAERPERAGLKLDPKGSYLTLTTCNPRYSARERLVVFARLISDPIGDSPESDAAVDDVSFDDGGGTLAELPGYEEALTLEAGLAGDPASRVPTILWGAVVAAVGLLWWWAYRRWHSPVTWFVGVLPFLVVLFGFYVYLERLLPAGY